MRNFVITTDSNSDLPKAYINENHIGVIPHYYDVDNVIYGDGIDLTSLEFYSKMREGFMPTTMASNPAVIHDIFMGYIEKGMDILHISFSSGLSSGCDNVKLVAKEIMEEYTNANIIVIDSLNVSLGQGMLIDKAIRMKKNGKTMDEIFHWISENKLHYCVLFTVDDLHHLYRGGRVSKATAILGSMINVKPILYVNNEGELVSLTTVRGRKRSLSTLLKTMEERIGKYIDNQNLIGIVHGDALEDAKYLKQITEEKFPNARIVIHPVSPSIGAHSGPGAIGICFIGENR